MTDKRERGDVWDDPFFDDVEGRERPANVYWCGTHERLIETIGDKSRAKMSCQAQEPQEMVKEACDIRFGDWAQTFTGKRYFPLDPRPEDIDIEDIAHHLSWINRYNGALPIGLSVAQHSVHVADMCHLYGGGMHRARWGLLHDAHEAYISDMVRPFKRSMPFFRVVEERWQKVMAKKFGLEPDHEPPEVKEADVRVCVTEKRDLQTEGPGKHKEEVRGGVSAYPENELKIICWTAAAAKRKFLERFRELWPYGA